MTLLPALLVTFGRAVNWPRRGIAPLARPGGGEGFWTRWAEMVMRRPWGFLAAAGLVLLVFVLPAFRLRHWNIGASHLPPETEARRGYEALAAQFPRGFMGPLVGLVEARPGATVWQARSRAAVLSTAGRLAHDPRSGSILGLPQILAVAGEPKDPGGTTPELPDAMKPVARRLVSEDGRVAFMALVTPKEPGHPETMAYLRELRRQSWPELESAGLEVRWGGSSAVMNDFDQELFGRLPRVVLGVVAVTFVVLAALFRSLLIPLKATLLNVLSVLAAYGFLVMVFQDGLGAGLLGIDPPGGLNSFIVLMLFTILFGLSMDYEVFLLSRVREEYQASGDNARAVAAGVARTARVITCAALIMISIFAAFGFTRLIPTREFGLGLAFATLLDATLIRVVLVPALMVVSGRWNWWWPRGRRRK
jgi:RND superfamily putative drug exporter